MTTKHFTTNNIIHFDHAYLNPTNRLPILYIFKRKKINVLNYIQKFSNLYPKNDNIILIYNTKYNHILNIKKYIIYYLN